MPRWTEEQKRAIEVRGTNLLVSAAAGSGKTAVLTERILSLLREGADLSDMLVITFTNAAAAEMRERISRSLAMGAGENPHLRRQWQERDIAAISTIHAFCIRLLRRFFVPAGVDIGFTVLDQPQTDQFWKEALEEAADELCQDREKREFLFRLGEMKKVLEMATQVQTFLQNQPYPEKWEETVLEQYRSSAEDFASGPVAAYLRESQRQPLLLAAGLLREAEEISGRENGPAYFLPMIREAAGSAQAFLSGSRGNLKFQRLSSAKGGDADLREEARRRIDRARDLIKRAAEAMRGCLEGDTGTEEVFASLLPGLETLFALIGEAQKRFERRKTEAGALSFSDLEHKALALLEEEEIAAQVRETWPYIFVDEYQDTNPVQEALLQRIATDGKLFTVGDVKQSIYRFRMADPTLFVQRRQRYIENPDQGTVIDLNRNFRSREEILAFCNRLFLPLMQAPLSEVVYGEAEALYPGRETAEPAGPDTVSLHLLTEEDGQEEDGEMPGNPEEDGNEEKLSPEEMSAVLQESVYAVNLIRSLLAQQTQDPGSGEMRPIRYGDIAILIRSPKSRIQPLMQTLAEAGIPFYSDAGGGFYEAYEVRVFLSLLSLCVNFENDYALLTVLRALYRLPLQALADLRLCDRDGSLYEAACLYAQGEGAEAEKVASLLSRLAVWRRRAWEMPLGTFMQEILIDSRIWALCAAMPQGAARQANLYALCSHAAKYEGRLSLRGFLNLCENLRERGDGGDAQQIEPEQNVVRIMSVHKSKGLEFPVVIGMFLGGKMRLSGRSDCLTDERMGMGVSLYDTEYSLRSDTPLQKALLLHRKRQEMAEEIRILYVLCTRAREKLLLTGYVRKLSTAREKWKEMRAVAGGMEQAGSLLDFVCASLADSESGALLRTGEPAAGLEERDPDGMPADAAFCVKVVRGIQPSFAAEDPGTGDAGEGSVPEWLRRTLSWSYPYESKTLPMQKLSVSALSRRRGILPPEERPAFLKENRGLTSAQRGTVLHTFLEHMDYVPFRTIPQEGWNDEVQRQIAGMREKGILTPQEADVIRTGQITRYLAAPLGRKITESQALFRETPFNLAVTETEDGTFTLAGPDSPNMALLQGVIDLYFPAEENGRKGWILVDYKTDRYELSEEEVIANHAEQVDWYRRALEILTGIPVLRESVFLFHIGKEINLPFPGHS